ncbi:uncharacterized protein [Littorina saxatilis]
MTKTMEATSAAETDMSDGKTEAIFLDEKTHQQRSSVGTMECLAQDADICKFLVHMYLATKERDERQVVCVFCRSPLNPVCDACKTRRSQSSIPGSDGHTSAKGRCPAMLIAQAEDMSKDIHRNVTAFSSPSSLPGAGDTDGDWNQCAVTSVKSASPESSHSAGQCLEPTSVTHSHKAGQLTEESEAVRAAGSACSEAGEAGKRQTRPVKRRGRRKSCISDDNRDDISDDDNCADQTNEPSQWPEAGDRETKHTTAATQSICIYLGVEDLDTASCKRSQTYPSPETAAAERLIVWAETAAASGNLRSTETTAAAATA